MNHEATRQHRRGTCSCQRGEELAAAKLRAERARKVQASLIELPTASQGRALVLGLREASSPHASGRRGQIVSAKAHRRGTYGKAVRRRQNGERRTGVRARRVYAQLDPQGREVARLFGVPAHLVGDFRKANEL